jgi:hypothetical protein
MAPLVQNKRRYERFHHSFPAEIRVVRSNQGSAGEVLHLLTKDICAGGAYFYTSHPLVEGTEVKLDIVLEVVRFKELTGHFPAIKVNGTVLRAEVSGMAIGFDKDYKILPV